MGWGVSGQCAFSLLLPGTYREVFPATAQLSTPLSSELEPLFAVDFSQPSSRPEAISCLENPMGRGAWQTTIHGLQKNLTQLSN